MMLSLSACSDSDDWTPGPAATDNMCVYFTKLPASSLLLTVEDQLSATATLTRNEYSEAASVPLKCESSVEGVTVPATVDFQAGEQTAVFTIDFSGVPVMTACDIKVSVDPAYSNIYAAGTSSVTMNIFISDWEVYAEDVKYSYASTFGTTTGGIIYNLSGTSLFKLKNFMNSGLDLQFTLGDNYPGFDEYFEFVPVSNCIWSTEIWPDNTDYASQRMWFVYDSATSEYPVWSPDPSTGMTIEYCWVFNDYWLDGNFSSYVGVFIPHDGAPATGYADLNFWTDYTDESGEWNHLYISFTPLFNPFTGEPNGAAE